MYKQWTYKLISALVMGSLFIHMPALAKPDHGKGNDHPGQGSHGRDHGPKHSGNDDRDRREDHDHGDTHVNVDIHFGDQQRTVIRDYYGAQFDKGRCPPGLAKKRNGCMPPGQAKKWRRGYPLPREVVYYDLPPQVVIQMGAPPAGYKYVRVAADILMIAIGTGMVVDAIEDLSRM